MGLPRINRFKVETVWPQLFQRRIQAIEIKPQEIQVVNRNGRLMADGAFARVITWREIDGRSGTIGDWVQFQVDLGQALSEPLPTMDMELISESYIFQTRFGEPLLEQVLVLTVKARQVVCEVIAVEGLVFEGIIGRHYGRDLLKLMISFPEITVCPRHFQGVIVFKETTGPVLSGNLSGIIEYVTAHCHLGLLEVDKVFGIVVKSAPHFPECRRRVKGRVTGYCWTQVTARRWALNVTFEYGLFDLRLQTLSCFKLPNEAEETGRWIKTGRLIQERDFCLVKTWAFPFGSGEPYEVNVSVIAKTEQLTPKGLLMDVLYKIELYYIGRDGAEGYDQWEKEDTQLIEGLSFTTNFGDLKFDGSLQVNQIRFELVGQKLMVGITTAYHLQVFSAFVERLQEDEFAGMPVMANVLKDRRYFSILKEAIFRLNKEPHEIHQIRTNFVPTEVRSKRGWLQVNGNLAVSISYFQSSGEVIEEHRKISFEHSFVWNDLNEDDQLELQAKIEFDTYRFAGRRVGYHYLIGFDVQCYQVQEVYLKTLAVAGQGVSASIMDSASRQGEGDIWCLVEEEFQVVQGGWREIALKRIFVQSLTWRNALNAFFVEGDLLLELECRNQRGRLAYDQLIVHFWKFIPVFGQKRQFWRLDDQSLPWIQSATFIPVKAWPGRKGIIRAVLRLKLVKE